MRKIQIICDSSCDISIQDAEKLGIVIQPLSISFDLSKSYRDQIDIDVDTLYQKVAEVGKTPKTAAMLPGQYFEIFEKYLAKGYDIIYTGIGSGFSSSYSTACFVAEEVSEDHIEIVDSKNLSTGIALILYKALDWIKEGKDVHEVAELMRQEANQVRSQFAIDTMEYLHKGGRCGGMANLIGTILKIHPIIQVRDNQMVVAHKPRGKLNVAIDMMIEDLAAEKDNVCHDIITITHSKADEYVAYTKQKIEELIPDAKVIVTNAGCIVSSHCGPGTLGFFYRVKK